MDMREVGAMTSALIVLGVLVVVYGLAAAAVLAVHRFDPPEGAPERPPLSRRLAARYASLPEAVPVDRKLAGQEADAVRQLLDGDLDRAAYQARMAAVAALDAVEHPLGVPKSQL